MHTHYILKSGAGWQNTAEWDNVIILFVSLPRCSLLHWLLGSRPPFSDAVRSVCRNLAGSRANLTLFCGGSEARKGGPGRLGTGPAARACVAWSSPRLDRILGALLLQNGLQALPPPNLRQRDLVLGHGCGGMARPGRGRSSAIGRNRPGRGSHRDDLNHMKKGRGRAWSAGTAGAGARSRCLHGHVRRRGPHAGGQVNSIALHRFSDSKHKVHDASPCPWVPPRRHFRDSM